MHLPDKNIGSAPRSWALPARLCRLPVWLLLGTTCLAATNETAVVANGGGWVTNGSFRSVVVAGQAQPLGVTSNGAYRSLAGFMHTFVLNPLADHDVDGIADEIDQDDDNDSLPDIDELTGTAFEPAAVTDPMSADSDGDGQTDAAEARAGTNPLDAASVLAIVDVTFVDGQVRIAWKGRQDFHYHILAAPAVDALNTAAVVVGTASVVNGSGPWQEAVPVFFAPAVSGDQIINVKCLGRSP